MGDVSYKIRGKGNWMRAFLQKHGWEIMHRSMSESLRQLYYQNSYFSIKTELSKAVYGNPLSRFQISLLLEYFLSSSGCSLLTQLQGEFRESGNFSKLPGSCSTLGKFMTLLRISSFRKGNISTWRKDLYNTGRGDLMKDLELRNEADNKGSAVPNCTVQYGSRMPSV